MSIFPTLFVSHGAPTLALEPGNVGSALETLGRELPSPTAILVVSAHWGTKEPSVSISENPETIYDFHGFPASLNALDYPAPGSPSLAYSVIDCLRQAGWPEGHAVDRGLDHGAWVPLLYMFPKATIPVVQLSIQYNRDPIYHYRLGQALRPLRSQGILILASGSLTHNLFETSPEFDAPPVPYVDSFRQWIVAHLHHGRIDDLLNYRTLAPYAERAHPSEDHLLPLFVALGAVDGEPGFTHINAGTMHQVLAMDAFVLGESEVVETTGIPVS